MKPMCPVCGEAFDLIHELEKHCKDCIWEKMQK